MDLYSFNQLLPDDTVIYMGSDNGYLYKGQILKLDKFKDNVWYCIDGFVLSKSEMLRNNFLIVDDRSYKRPSWIPVNQREPVRDGRYVIITKDNITDFCTYIKKIKKFRSYDSATYRLEEVEAFIEIPEYDK